MKILNVLLFLCFMTKTVICSVEGTSNKINITRLNSLDLSDSKKRVDLNNLKTLQGSDKEVTPHEFPFIVNIAESENHYSFCGGTILTRWVILTAAHCFKNEEAPEGSIAIAGDHDQNKIEGTEQIQKISKIIFHPDYINVSGGNDIALVILASPLFFTREVSDIKLNNGVNSLPQSAITAGWGTTSYSNEKTTNGEASTILLKASIPIIRNHDCNSLLKGGTTIIYEDQLCAGGIADKEACQGDSGGPLICKDKEKGELYLCGIGSYGDNCGQPKKPGIFTRVTSFVDWGMEECLNYFDRRSKPDCHFKFLSDH